MMTRKSAWIPRLGITVIVRSSDCKVPFSADGGCDCEPSPIWHSQVCFGRPGGLLQPEGGRVSVRRARAHSRASVAETPLSSRATCPKSTQAMARDGVPTTEWRTILSGDFFVGDTVTVIPLYLEEEEASCGWNIYITLYTTAQKRVEVMNSTTQYYNSHYSNAN